MFPRSNIRSNGEHSKRKKKKKLFSFDLTDNILLIDKVNF